MSETVGAALRAFGPPCRAAWFVAAVLAVSDAPASTPAAWTAFDQEVLRACVAASTLKDPQAAGSRVDFDDQAGVSLLLLTGHYSQPRMHNKPGAELCLFDRRTRKAVVTEADHFVAPKAATAPTPSP